jgi:hypothetical protein
MTIVHTCFSTYLHTRPYFTSIIHKFFFHISAYTRHLHYVRACMHTHAQDSCVPFISLSPCQCAYTCVYSCIHASWVCAYKSIRSLKNIFMSIYVLKCTICAHARSQHHEKCTLSHKFTRTHAHKYAHSKEIQISMHKTMYTDLFICIIVTKSCTRKQLISHGTTPDGTYICICLLTHACMHIHHILARSHNHNTVKNAGHANVSQLTHRDTI